MLRLFKRLFPEKIFRRKLEPDAERRLRLVQARAEESIVRTHVDNALMFVDTLAQDMSFDRAIDTYVREMSIPEPLASVVATRTLVVLGSDLVPFRRRALEGEAGVQPAAQEERPKLRLNDASQGRQRGVRKAEGGPSLPANRAD
jgi:hypothetical protein